MKKSLMFVVLCALVFGPLAMPVEATVDSTSDTSDESVEFIELWSDGTEILWEVGGKSDQGFKVTWSKTEGPTYPLRDGDKYHYFSNYDKDSDTLEAFDGAGTYYVRVCEYLGGKCGLYSNEISLELGVVEVEEEETNDDVSIALSANGTVITWEIEGTSLKGYKVVWSMDENPTYPTRKYDRYAFYASPNAKRHNLKAFNGDGKYYVRVCEYLGGKCGTYSNQIEVMLAEKEELIACTMDYTPVCGRDGKTYSNKCMMGASKVQYAYMGECKLDEEIEAIKENAEKLKNNNLDSILAELKELRDQVREQKSEIKYLASLLKDVSGVTDEMQESINNFITYGVDDNTKRLGSGERAAVMHSFKAAFGKLPENKEDLEDAIKIANGRFPSIKNEEAEENAKERFKKIYKRIANEEDDKDNAAIKVMAYGLRQRAENRNLESEKNAIKTFKSIYGHNPASTEEWNTMQAITYSGASRGVDTDGDLLIDSREDELGTDKNNKDTDGDGFWDGVEVANGFDPLKE